MRKVLSLFHRNVGDWIPGKDVRARVTRPSGVDVILQMLVECSVLESEGAPPEYRYVEDPLVEIEMQRYLRRAEHRDQNIQTNVARFRNRYNCP